MKQFLSLIMIFAFIAGCASSDKNADTPEGLYSIAQEYENAERFELAIQKYTDVKNKYPYSNLATQAELAIADVHYKAESWPEAQVAYQTFRDLHPTHAKTDYVIFRAGMSFYKQLPETIDRDLSLAKDTIVQFDEVIKRFPQSEYFEEAKSKRSEVIKMLGEKEQYIADFYFKRKNFDSALGRYESLLKNYGPLGFEEHALARAAIAASELDLKEKAKQFSEQLKRKFPRSSSLDDVQKALK